MLKCFEVLRQWRCTSCESIRRLLRGVSRFATYRLLRVKPLGHPHIEDAGFRNAYELRRFTIHNWDAKLSPPGGELFAVEFRNTRILGTKRTAIQTPTSLWIEGLNCGRQWRDKRRFVGAKSIWGGRVLLEGVAAELRLAEGVYVGTYASSNWYHWLAEICPRIAGVQLLGDNSDSLPLLIDLRVKGLPRHEEVLKLLAPTQRVVYLPPWSVAEVERLLWIEVPALTAAGNCGLNWQGASMRRFALDALRESARTAFRESGPEFPKRVFLDRGDSARRTYNRDEVLDVLTRHDFVPVRAEHLSFADQVRIFASAECIVGPSGAALTGMLFADAGARVLYWANNAHNFWEELAETSGALLECFLVATSAEDAGEYFVDVSELERRLLRLL